jgi:hypothetical protein
MYYNMEKGSTKSGSKEKYPNSVMIFCDNKTKINKIVEELQEARIPNFPFYDAKDMNSKMRTRTLALLHQG